MDKLNETLRNHKSITQSTLGTIASMGLEKAGQKVAGVLVTPAVWMLNHSVDGSKPGAVDVGLYASGFFSGGAATIVGLFKSHVDDDMNRKLALIRKNEDPKYAPFIQNCYDYGSSPAGINAQTIASKGGTAWKHSTGLWVYITDAQGRMIKDFKPKSYVVIYQPKQPLVKQNGKLVWGITR